MPNSKAPGPTQWQPIVGPDSRFRGVANINPEKNTEIRRLTVHWRAETIEGGP